MDLRFDVNLSMLFTELPLLERPAAAAAAGFDAVELWWPWPDEAVPAARELDALYGALEGAGTQLVGLNFYAGRLPGPDKGALSVPALSEAFRANVEVVADFAARTGCTALNALYGNRVAGATAGEQDALALENLAHAARVAGDRAGAVVLIEPQNPHDAPDYPLLGSAPAVELAERVNAATGRDNAKFLLDVYHLARCGEDPLAAIKAYGGTAGHVQVADAPGRGAPGTDALDFGAVFAELDAAGYRGWIGLEHKAGGAGSAEAVRWVEQYR